MGEARRKNKRQRGSRGTRCVATLWLLYAFLLLRAVPPGPSQASPHEAKLGSPGLQARVGAQRRGGRVRRTGLATPPKTTGQSS